MQAEIDCGPPGKEKVVLDGVDVSKGFNGLELRMRVGDIPTLRLEAPLFESGWVRGEVKVEMLPETHQALVDLGWTPPGEMPGLSEVKRLSVKPGDVLVVKAPKGFDAERCHRLQAAVSKVFPANEIVIVVNDVDLEVVSTDAG